MSKYKMRHSMIKKTGKVFVSPSVLIFDIIEGDNPMADNKSMYCRGGTSLGNNGSVFCKETVCIDCNRVLDSCRDKDCFENVKVYLTDLGQEIVDKTSNLRLKCAKVVSANVSISPIQFNCGFYQVNVRFYVKLVFEACTCGGKSQEFEGIAVCEKSVVLYGSEGNVRIFKSNPNCSNFCNDSEENSDNSSSNLPVAVVETLDPVFLDYKILSKDTHCKCCCCCSCCEEIPDNVCYCLSGNLTNGEEDDKNLYVTLGFFSVIRIERPAQFLVQATEYNVPEKTCVAAEHNDPCAMFYNMDFPTNEFSPESDCSKLTCCNYNNNNCCDSHEYPHVKENQNDCGCEKNEKRGCSGSVRGSTTMSGCKERNCRS